MLLTALVSLSQLTKVFKRVLIYHLQSFNFFHNLKDLVLPGNQILKIVKKINEWYKMYKLKLDEEMYDGKVYRYMNISHKFISM